MIYITVEDLQTDIYERFILESAEAGPGDTEPPVLADIEGRAISLVKTYLSDRYDTDKIFDETNPIKNVLLVDVISRIVLYRLVRRNAARKVPTDVKEDYDAAIKTLEKLSAGRPIIAELPKPTDDSGNPTGASMFGNNSNKDYYI